MNDISSSDLKTILHSKRANIYYLEHCRVMVKGGRVEYITKAGRESQYWNIPIANTTSILLGSGTSITQKAVRELSKAGVLIGFCGGDGTPLFSATEINIDMCWLTPQSEYRPTEYLQKWISFWFGEKKRLEAAKLLQLRRLDFVEKSWKNKGAWKSSRVDFSAVDLKPVLDRFRELISQAESNTILLTQEAELTKKLYKFISQITKYGDFTRVKQGMGVDRANRLLDQGNYLAYGVGATATWVLGLPHGLSVLHGKTRRGGLVFDAADLIKDALILPQAFISAVLGDNNREFRQACTDNLVRCGAIDYIIDTLKDISQQLGEVS